jgi:hypothetical protein
MCLDGRFLACLKLQSLYYFFFFQTLAKSLQQLLDYEEPDMEDTFMQTFRIGFRDIFGNSVHHDLQEGGAEIFVTQQNKRVSVPYFA